MRENYRKSQTISSMSHYNYNIITQSAFYSWGSIIEIEDHLIDFITFFVRYYFTSFFKFGDLFSDDAMKTGCAATISQKECDNASCKCSTMT